MTLTRPKPVFIPRGFITFLGVNGVANTTNNRFTSDPPISFPEPMRSKNAMPNGVSVFFDKVRAVCIKGTIDAAVIEVFMPEQFCYPRPSVVGVSIGNRM